MILQKNLFIEYLLPLRKIPEDAMEVYRRYYRIPGPSRQPILSWTRELPIAGEPADVVAIVEDYAKWLSASPIPKLFIDAEPVSTTAYCRFLNSVGTPPAAVLADWFVLAPDDDRNAHAVIAFEDEWRPVPGTERWPMVLVSWYGANAYSLWANGRDWADYRDDAGAELGSFLPSEAQWEYAARGPRYRLFPWGDEPPTPEHMRFGRHRRSAAYDVQALPMAGVNEPLGVSPFGLHHAAGNVWQWCRDWYDEDFYRKPAARGKNAANRSPTGVRSERGGSWVGPAELCRSSYRRGRPVTMSGECFGNSGGRAMPPLRGRRLRGGRLSRALPWLSYPAPSGLRRFFYSSFRPRGSSRGSTYWIDHGPVPWN